MRSVSASPWIVPLLVGAFAACSSPETAQPPEDVPPADVPVGTDKPTPEDTFVPPDVPAPPPDAGEPVDVPAPPRDVFTPPRDVFTPPPDRPVLMDVPVPPPDVPARVDVQVTPDVPARMDVVVTPDVPVRPDVPVVMDVPVVTDRPVADAGTPVTGNPVLMYLNDPQRTGSYRAETRLTPAALRAGRLARVTTFNPTLEGALYSQPLYVPGLSVGGATRDVLFVATEGNFIYALDADTGAQLWRTAVGSTVARAQQSCGNISTIGVTSTPVIDLATRTLYAVSFTSNSGLRFRLNALDLATGTQRAGYPAAIQPPASNGSTFDETVTGQRGALGFREGRVYVPFGGLYGDCGIYHGWVVGIDAANPMRQVSFATPGRGSGIWAPAGLSMDAAGRIFVATGNSTPLGGSTPGSLGEFVLRLASGASGPTFSMTDMSAQFSPTDARTLDLQDLDIGSIAPVVLPVPAGATPLVLQAGKAGTAYVLNANNLGGTTPLTSTRLASGGVYGAMGAWANATETYAFVPVRGTRAGCSGSNGVVALRVQPSSTGATLTTAWCSASVTGANPPVVTSNGNADAVLWVVGAATPGVLRAYEVATGMEIYANTEPPPSARQWVPPVVADGRVYVTGSNSIALYRLR